MLIFFRFLLIPICIPTLSSYLFPLNHHSSHYLLFLSLLVFFTYSHSSLVSYSHFYHKDLFLHVSLSLTILFHFSFICSFLYYFVHSFLTFFHFLLFSFSSQLSLFLHVSVINHPFLPFSFFCFHLYHFVFSR